MRDLQKFGRQDCFETGSSSKEGGTCPYIISQLMSSKSAINYTCRLCCDHAMRHE